ncbi:MAG TPA: 3-oxoacyl-ACP reductase, partial [Gammaproteobacteria bacterium]|nr:3-oxoacyl-ACP reductase [Gammaproteobacteria bacterium]
MTNLSSETLLNYQMPNSHLKDQSILITGAANGIGAALAERCAAAGATTILLDKDKRGLEAQYDKMEASGLTLPILHPLDLAGATPDEYHELVEHLEKQLGELNGLVLNAGWLGAYSPLVQYDAELYQKTMTINLHGHFFLIQACLPLLEKSTNPSVVFSTHRSDTAYSGAFGLAKAGVESLLHILADEYSGERYIRVNGVDTGPVNTAMRRLNFPGEDFDKNPTPESVINPYLYFLSSDSLKVTGHNVELMPKNRDQ